ncbi:hypothetical protein CAC42_2409 [Sphaceloma murrayae]|uniref:Uncharacterized protein n=1 Tax=Sphaceloma murrayae TaxID=2082308 RepID=A0A2K1QVZ7_9PEZI|nr:hypothetical protein CAC42_2409 [Sphaceloma murrayae]
MAPKKATAQARRAANPTSSSSFQHAIGHATHSYNTRSARRVHAAPPVNPSTTGQRRQAQTTRAQAPPTTATNRPPPSESATNPPDVPQQAAPSSGPPDPPSDGSRPRDIQNIVHQNQELNVATQSETNQDQREQQQQEVQEITDQASAVSESPSNGASILRQARDIFANHQPLPAESVVRQTVNNLVDMATQLRDSASNYQHLYEAAEGQLSLLNATAQYEGLHSGTSGHSGCVDRRQVAIQLSGLQRQIRALARDIDAAFVRFGLAPDSDAGGNGGGGDGDDGRDKGDGKDGDDEDGTEGGSDRGGARVRASRGPPAPPDEDADNGAEAERRGKHRRSHIHDCGTDLCTDGSGDPSDRGRDRTDDEYRTESCEDDSYYDKAGSDQPPTSIGNEEASNAPVEDPSTHPGVLNGIHGEDREDAGPQKRAGRKRSRSVEAFSRTYDKVTAASERHVQEQASKRKADDRDSQEAVIAGVNEGPETKRQRI